MSNIIVKIQSISDIRKSKGCSIQQVKDAQKELDLVFPEEYVDYVREFGCIDFGTTEWAGLNIKGYLNTVTATKREQSVNPDFPRGCFVLEDLSIDAKKVIVDENGKVFILQHNIKDQLCNSLEEYLDICMKR